jgi:serine/threonine-protein kinase
LVSQVEGSRGVTGETHTPPDDALYAAASWTGLPLANDASDPLIGTTLHDTYVVDHVIGEGGMGRVYEARHTRLPNKRFAIKVLHAELAMSTDLQHRFQREAETAASIEHPGVVGTYDIGRTPQGWQYMVCEHLKGLDLSSYVAREAPLPALTIVHLGKRLCEAVDAAHAQGVIHRALKPHNVFLVGDFALGVPERPNLKVLDFGLSRFVDRDSQLTKTGMIMGTPGYMSPEQANGQPTNPKTDIYGVGAILYAAATGRAPFSEETPQMTVLAVMSREPERPRALEPSIPESLEVIIQKAMARDPAQRYHDLREMHTALGSLETYFAPSMLPPREASDAAEIKRDARGARLHLALVLGGLALVVTTGLASAAAGLLALRGVALQPTTTEWVLLAALLGVSAAPAIVGLRRLHRHVWSNSARVVEWLERLRGPAVAGLSAYGVAALCTRALDELASSPSSALLGHFPGLSYRGYSVALPVVGLIGALAWAVHERWGRQGRSLKR